MIAPFLVLVAALTALGTLLTEYFADAVHSQGIVLFGLSLAIAAWLLWSRRNLLLLEKTQDDDSVTLERFQGDPGTVTGMLVVGILAAIFAHLVHSPWVAWGAFLFLIATVAYAEYGSRGLLTATPVLVLLLFIKPIPASLEPWAQLGLQASATNLTMMMLDFLRIFYFSEGNVLGLVSQQTLVPELFQGLHWLYPTVFIAIAWGIHFRYHWLRTFLNVFQTVLWVILWNAMRAAVLLANKEWGGTWLDSSVVMAISDYLAFAMILFFAWSGDQFFSSMMQRRNSGSTSERPDSREVRALLAPRWRLGIPHWIVVAGLLAIALLSIRMAGRYGWGLTDRSASSANLSLPEEINAWKVGEPSTSEFTTYDGTTIQTRSWPLERDGKKLTLAVASNSTNDPKALWYWKWMGWRQSGAAGSSTENGSEAKVPGALVRMERLPGETKTAITVGSDRYGHSHSETPSWQWWYRLPELLGSNAAYALGMSSAKVAEEAGQLPANHVATLSWSSAKPLDTEKTEQLRQVWEQAYPLIVDQLKAQPSN